MSLKIFRLWFVVLALGVLACGFAPARAQAQTGTGAPVAEHPSVASGAPPGHGAEAEKEKGTFEPEYGTWFHWLAKPLFRQDEPQLIQHGEEKYYTNIGSDFIVIALFVMGCLGLVGVLGARGMKERPEGKPHSLSHMVETAVEGYRDYLVGIMGPDLARKYAPLVSSFFFTILFFNWIGLVPGMLSPTANPNIPVSLAIVAFFSVHFIAIKEAGFKSWFMHLVGEPLWLAPLNFPLHLIGEIIKPISLAVRLLGNVFGEEMVVLNLSLLAIGIMSVLHVPIPLQFPMLCLGLFFGALQALVFSTLLAIYISILATNHNDHDEHNNHGHVEHVNDGHGHDRIIAHPSESTIG